MECFYPNQKKVVVSKKFTTGESYYLNGRKGQALSRAVLSSAGRCTYDYMITYGEGFSFALSGEYFCYYTLRSIDTYNKGIKDLKEKGFLVQVKGRTWIFYPESNIPIEELLLKYTSLNKERVYLVPWLSNEEKERFVKLYKKERESNS